MVLMPVGDKDAAHLFAVLHKVGHIRYNEIDTEHIVIRKAHAAIYNYNIVAPFKQGYVLSYLLQSAEGYDTELPTRLCRVAHRLSLSRALVFRQRQCAPRASRPAVRLRILSFLFSAHRRLCLAAVCAALFFAVPFSRYMYASRLCRLFLRLFLRRGSLCECRRHYIHPLCRTGDFPRLCRRLSVILIKRRLFLLRFCAVIFCHCIFLFISKGAISIHALL